MYGQRVPLAQLAEHTVYIRGVVGSSPIGDTHDQVRLRAAQADRALTCFVVDDDPATVWVADRTEACL